MPSERFNHLSQQGIGLLDLLLLSADFFFCLGDIRSVPLNQCRRFAGALAICLDPALRGKDPVPDRLNLVAGHGRRGIQLLKTLPESRELALLRRDLLLMDGPGGIALGELKPEVFHFGREIPVIPVGEMRVKCAEILHQRLVSPRLSRLPLKRSDLAFDFLDDVLHADEVHFRVFQLPERLLFLGFVFCDSSGFLEDCAPVLGPAAQDEVDLPLLHDRVGAPSDAGIHEELVDILQPADGFIQEIFTLAVTVDPASDPDFVPVRAQFLFALCKSH